MSSLEDCPKIIGDSFVCGYNKLTSLEFCPHTVKGDFYCNNNNLNSLEFCPATIGGRFYCQNNNIDNLIHFPDHIGGSIHLGNNNLAKINDDKFYNFEEIYGIHIEYKIKAQKDFLDDSISKNINFSSKKTSGQKTNKLKI